MRILLDTHLLYWWFYDTKKLSRKAEALIRGAEDVYVSAASLWEIAIKVRIGKIEARPQDVMNWTEKNDFVELPVTFRHAALVADLPLHHGDPFDRLLVAQAISEPLHLLTVDEQLKRYTELVVVV